ncbi:MAG: RnfABCDGE type electron transport complex subunit G [Paludibacteraceae bacterium]|nr:RnfABCDGE type electron transport complex subunit G [Paludibacteraceae bacterium]
MKRLESNFTNMMLSLTLVALVAAALLGGLYVVTEEPIANQKQLKQQAAITSVLPQMEGMTIAEAEQVDGNTIYRAYVNDEWVATAVQTEENGFGGKFKLMVGFDRDGNISGYEVLEHQETPGLGDKMTFWFKNKEKEKQNILGSNPGNRKFVVSKDGGEVDAITAATISSRAFLKATNKAYTAVSARSVEAMSGATIQRSDSVAMTESVEPTENSECHE